MVTSFPGASGLLGCVKAQAAAIAAGPPPKIAILRWAIGSETALIVQNTLVSIKVHLAYHGNCRGNVR